MNHCRIHPPGPAVDSGLVARLSALPTSIISDAQERVGGGPGILPVAPLPAGRSFGGRALTVRTRAGDNLVVHQALRMLEPGEVLVIDAGGATDRAILGEIMVRYARARGAAGIVVDGAVRNRDGIAVEELPVLARGITHLGPYKCGPGEIRGTVQLGGTTVRTGDVIVFDADGFVAVESDRAAVIADRAEERLRLEEGMLVSASAGATDYAWLDAALVLEGVAPEASVDVDGGRRERS